MREKRTAEERAADEARYQDQARRLKERIAYWRSKSIAPAIATLSDSPPPG
jgi:hypothetical protein